MRKHFAIGRVNGSLVLVVIDMRRQFVEFKTRGQKITLGDVFKNDHIFGKLVDCCYGMGDGEYHELDFDDHIAYYKTAKIPQIVALIQKYCDQEMRKEHFLCPIDNANTN